MEIKIFDNNNEWLKEHTFDFKKMASGFRFLEGPVWLKEDNKLIFSDIQGNALYVMDEKGNTEFLRKNSYLTNGNTLDNEGNLISCETGTSRVTRTNLSDGSYEVLVSHYQGKELNSPNDVIVSKTGDIYFTDPIPGRMGRVGIPRDPELDFKAVFRFDGDNLSIIDDQLILPNGLCFNENESILYVDDSKQKKIFEYTLDDNHEVLKKELFAEVDYEGDGVLDGMRMFNNSLLFSTGPGGIYIFNLLGKLLAKLVFPEVVTNLVFNDKQNAFYATATTCIYKVEIKEV